MSAKSLLDALDEMTFTGSQVAAAVGASPATLTRYYTSYGLALFTQTSTQGKRREFVLADVIQLGLAVDLARTTDRPKLVSWILNRMAGFEGSLASTPNEPNDLNTFARVSKSDHNKRLRADAVASVKSLPPQYWREDGAFFLNIWPGFTGFDILEGETGKRTDGLNIGISSYLNRLLVALANEVSED
ncbi:MAG: hypothetical protein SXU28_01330 [Pseudomonadota bacterium]|nr:hypothetical protein [Pseudomonadota bacterium]